MSAHLLTLYTRTPLHVGCGPGAELVDFPVARERVTGFPVIPATGLKGALREAARHRFGVGGEAKVRGLFGADRGAESGLSDGEPVTGQAGCLQIVEARLLAFPVRALKGCFAWLTCPAILHRLHRDTGKLAVKDIPAMAPDRALIAGRSDLTRDDRIYLEEYRLQAEKEPAASHRAVAAMFATLCADSLWQSRLAARLAIVSDDDFQHFVTACTEVVQRVEIDPETRVARPGHLFSQENLPCETLFYSVLRLLPGRGPAAADAEADLTALLEACPTLQVGGDQSTGHGYCAVKREPLS